MGIITDILKDIPLSAVLRERLIDQEKTMATLEAENLALKNENSDLKALVENLRQEIQQTKDIQKDKSHNTSFKMQLGCLLFAGDKRLYCPSCFHKGGNKIETSRVDHHNRYCAVCKTKIPSG